MKKPRRDRAPARGARLPPPADGTRKWLLDVGTGNAIETVFIPERNRGTLCVSSQAGCALECSFCSTGRQGFNRNLTVAEIIGQLWLANRRARTRRRRAERADHQCSHDGHGRAARQFRQRRGRAAAHARRQCLRTVAPARDLGTSGIVPAIDRLRDACPVALAVSLHAPNDALRDELVPINKKYPLKELLAACVRYLDKAPRDFITFEYVHAGRRQRQHRRTRGSS